MTASYPRISLPRDQIVALLAEHRDPDADHRIHLRPDGGWIIVTATHVLPDGTVDQAASTDEALAMHNEDLQQM
ncbi:hypothetical protein ACIA9I_12480 [Streptomyces anulatus]